MLDIVVLIVCGRKLAEMVRRKGYPAWPIVLMMIAFWYGGAFGLAVVAGVVTAIVDPNAGEPNMLLVLALVFAGGATGLGLTFLTARLLPDRSPQDEDEEYDGDYDDEPRSRRRDHDYDDEPRRGRRYDDRDDGNDRGDRYDDDRGRRYGG